MRLERPVSVPSRASVTKLRTPPDRRGFSCARSRMQGMNRPQIFRAHWFCAVAFVPFAAMLALQRAWGLSDSMGYVQTGQRPPTGFEIAYNYALLLAFYGGLGGYSYFVYAAIDRGIGWAILKVALFVVGLYALLWWW